MLKETKKQFSNTVRQCKKKKQHTNMQVLFQTHIH